MRRHALLDRFSLLAACAAVAAHANARAEGFRQRDFQFLLDLIYNWIESAFPSGAPVVQRTQVLRYLRELESEGLVRALTRSARPLYRLTRSGLIELIARVARADSYERPEHFFFVHYFIKNYREKILNMVRAEGKQFPYALEVELVSLLDAASLLKRERARIEREVRKLDARLSDSRKAARLTAECLAKNVPHAEIVRRWERECPYGLNSQKPLHELFSEIAPDIAAWELQTGNARRIDDLWAPSRAMLRAYQECLANMKG